MLHGVLGTDGFGRVDTRANLRHSFEVDRHHVAVVADGKMTCKDVARAIKRYKIEAEKPNPTGV